MKGPFKMKGPSLLKMVEEEKKHFLERDKVGPIATKNKTRTIDDKKDHNISANITEGSVESQDLRRKENKKKKYPKSYTKEDIKFLEEQREDVVREEDKK